MDQKILKIDHLMPECQDELRETIKSVQQQIGADIAKKVAYELK
jgi:hypothetical protein